MTPLLPLSPVEHLFTGAGAYPITMSFSYEKRLDIDAMRVGLVAAVRELPWVSSCLCAVDEKTWGLSLDSELELESADELVSVETRKGEPMARLVLSTDGRRLGASISHAVVDGFSYFQFLSSWARLTRGDRILSPSRDTLPMTVYGDTVTPEALLERCGVPWDEVRRPVSLRAERVQITNDELRGLREQTDSRLFDNDLIAARLWKSHGRSHDGVSMLTVPIDLRPLLRARRYFGCAVGFVTLRRAEEEVQSASLIELACAVRAAVAGYGKEAAARGLGMLERLRYQEGRAVMECLHVRHPRAGLIVTNLTRAPLRDLDFGGGPPESFHAVSQADCSAALFAAEDSVEAHVYLPA